MPSCSKARNPRGIEITFTEDNHKYVSIVNGKEISYVSGTGFVSRFFPEFDPTGEITKRCAKKEGLTVEALKAKWSAKGRESCRLGTRMHETCEDVFLGNSFRNTPEDETEKKRFENAIAMSRKIKDRLDIIGVEKIVFDEQLQLAGTIDFLGKSKKDGSYIIIDHKSNQEIETFNKWKKFAFEPIPKIPDTNFGHYTCQLNLYQYLLKYGQYVPKDARFKMFLNHVTDKEAKLIEIPDIQPQIKDMIIYFLVHKEDFFNAFKH